MQHLLKLLLIIYFSSCTLTFAKSAKVKAATDLSLKDAIDLAVRENPNVVINRLSYLNQKYNLRVQEWQFEPHYSLQAEYNQTRSASTGSDIVNGHSWNVTPAASLVT